MSPKLFILWVVVALMGLAGVCLRVCGYAQGDGLLVAAMILSIGLMWTRKKSPKIFRNR